MVDNYVNDDDADDEVVFFVSSSDNYVQTMT